MTDRPALALTIVQTLREELGALVFDDDAVPLVARVLAEHETAHQNNALADTEVMAIVEAVHHAIRGKPVSDVMATFPTVQRAIDLWGRCKAAEARRAQCEAEHERLRAALKEVLRLGNRISDRPAAMGWKDIDDLCELIGAAGAALAPSQEPK